ncbi:Do family serine endopeptidase [Rheinheimera mesophila]|uniref:Do family serine endopeptidase n=1 Tax=Rheinheimera mesophila TaxID=1547515 RepID=A0A3P3QT52_9GAMM|nr:Do family serine endopeptidase [Rheinheimera mesophila]KKL01927.1 serine endoprotease DegQ [Rheinheimera mesophila]RRJ23938.1 Do family serine endopeptidase [Rheinheimera mesophila]
MKSQLSLVSVSIFAAFLLAQPAPAHAKLPFFGAGDQEMPSLAPMLENVTPAVVNISVAGSREVRQRLPGALEQFLGRGGELRQEQPFRGLGSGVIIDAKKGYVVTNHHVINEASEIQVTLKDGRSYKAKKIGEDPESDIALLQIEAEDLTQVALADSDALRVGDFTIAIGNPFGLGQTVTSGIVSALGRGGLGIEGYEDFIQTDAAINSGNSGGALVNLKGELIGINTAILGPNGGNIGIGFAIPANMMKNLVAQFIEYGEVRRGALGVRGGDLNAEIAKAMKAKTNKGGWVQEVIPGSAADKAGLKSGDIITHLNGKKIGSFTEIRAKIATLGVGKEITLGILREDKAMTVKVTLEAAEATTAEAKVLHPMLEGASLSDGKTPDGEAGVVINDVAGRSPAAALGLEKGDVIVGVSRSRVTTTKELRDILSKSSGVIALQIQRGERILYVLIR